MRGDLYWGTGKTHKLAQLLPLVESIRSEQPQGILHQLKALLNFEHQLLHETLINEVKILVQIKDAISRINISRF